MRMQTNQPWGYLAPEVEVVTIAVEQGFQGSIETPVEKPEQDW